MRKIGVLFFAGMLFLGLLTACGAEVAEPAVDDAPAAEIAQVEPTAEAIKPTATQTAAPTVTETAVPPTAVPTATVEAHTATDEVGDPAPTVEPTQIPNPEVMESKCMACHQDEELLMQMAEPEEEPEETESSGVG